MILGTRSNTLRGIHEPSGSTVSLSDLLETSGRGRVKPAKPIGGAKPSTVLFLHGRARFGACGRSGFIFRRAPRALRVCLLAQVPSACLGPVAQVVRAHP